MDIKIKNTKQTESLILNKLKERDINEQDCHSDYIAQFDKLITKLASKNDQIK